MQAYTVMTGAFYTCMLKSAYVNRYALRAYSRRFFAARN